MIIGNWYYAIPTEFAVINGYFPNNDPFLLKLKGLTGDDAVVSYINCKYSDKKPTHHPFGSYLAHGRETVSRFNAYLYDFHAASDAEVVAYRLEN